MYDTISKNGVLRMKLYCLLERQYRGFGKCIIVSSITWCCDKLRDSLMVAFVYDSRGTAARAEKKTLTVAGTPIGKRDGTQSRAHAVPKIRRGLSELFIPVWLMQLEDEYQLDIGQFPEKISLQTSINRASLKTLSIELRNHGYLYQPQLKTFQRGDGANEV